ncbi:hypothetical protein OTU49_004747 [Cherax quadricarinatus]|uniref:Uncharacterized protein n=1 Tax=Cherax quadricarinatus TaxID=27406 RepID=A0AAW0WX84_CHEQU
MKNLINNVARVIPIVIITEAGDIEEVGIVLSMAVGDIMGAIITLGQGVVEVPIFIHRRVGAEETLDINRVAVTGTFSMDLHIAHLEEAIMGMNHMVEDEGAGEVAEGQEVGGEY